MIKDSIKPSGSIHIVLHDKNGFVKEEFSIENMIMDAGRVQMAALLSPGSTKITHLAVGTGTTAEAATQTALVTEIGTRVGVAYTAVTTTITNDAAQFVATFAAGNGTGALTEAGLFSQLALGGTMFARKLFPVINKGASDALTFTWKITMA